MKELNTFREFLNENLEEEILSEGYSIPIARRTISFKTKDVMIYQTAAREGMLDQFTPYGIVADVMGGGPGKSGTIAKITNFDAVKAEKEKNPTGGIPLELEMMNGLDPKGVVGINMLMIRKGRVSAVVERLRKEYENQLKDQEFKLKSLNGVTE